MCYLFLLLSHDFCPQSAVCNWGCHRATVTYSRLCKTGPWFFNCIHQNFGSERPISVQKLCCQQDRWYKTGQTLENSGSPTQKGVPNKNHCTLVTGFYWGLWPQYYINILYAFYLFVKQFRFHIMLFVDHFTEYVQMP